MTTPAQLARLEAAAAAWASASEEFLAAFAAARGSTFEERAVLDALATDFRKIQFAALMLVRNVKTHDAPAPSHLH